MKNCLRSPRCAMPMMSKRLVNSEELGRLIAQTSGSVTMINDSHYTVRSTSGNNTYALAATQSG
jgi:hypothetical protein